MKSTRIAISTAILSITLLICALHFPHMASAAPAAWQEVNIWVDTTLEYWPGGKMFMNATLPENTPLPAMVEILVPAGREISWVGEILGGPLENNPRAQYRRIPYNDDFETLRAVLTQSRILRVELFGAGTLEPQEGFTTARVSWQTPSAIPIIRLAVVVPAGSTMTTGPANILVGSFGENRISYYTEHRDVSAGDAFELQLGYVPPATIPGSGRAATGQDSQGLIFPAAALLSLALIAGALLAMRKKPRRE